MKKFLAAILILVVVIAVASEIILPRVVTNLLKEQIVKATHAQEVELILDATPNAKILIGDVDKIYGTASRSKIGDVPFEALTLDAEKISVDISEIISPTPSLNDNQRADKILKSAGRIELSGIVTEEGLRDFIEHKVDKLDKAQIKITENEASASGQIKVLGKTADVDIAGNFFLDDGNIYFRATRLDIRNTLVRNVQIDRYLGEVKILESSQLPIGLKFSSVQMRDGDVLITATR
ncbi:MAG: LmeA family phospholipid-binding protein [Selenomonadaceae bacterium]|nr:LmeA family phospholipid-binding protein [Selenomonadaceae bacterium]